MNLIFSLALIVCIFAQVLGSPQALNDEGAEVLCTTPVKTASGLVAGKIVKSANGKEVCAYLGIPYAKPPTDDLRFKKPVPFGTWEGTFDATKWPNCCMQVDDDPGGIWSPNTPLSEDCLYLNIWVPLATLKAKGSLAVMIWIYGGALTTGTSTLDMYEGATLSGDSEVVVASMQYRLGPLGFLYFGCDEAPGNLGLLDQTVALEWLKANIAQFGGNPNEFTVFGESAGAFSVSYLMISPLAKHLVNRAIMMSGAATSHLLYRTPKEAKEISYELAEGVGCYSPKEKQSVPVIMDCMRKTDADKITAYQIRATKFIDYFASVTVDGTFLTDTPANLLSRGENSRAEIMVGNVQYEGSLFLLLNYPEFFSWDESVLPQISYDDFQTLVRHITRNSPPAEQDAILTRYTNWINVDDKYANLRKIVDLAGDFTLLCPSVDFAQKWASQGLKVYYYSFTQRSSNSHVPKWGGAKHADDCDYIFGNLQKEVGRDEKEKNLSKKFQLLVSNFAKTGVPSEKWGQYTPAYPIYLDLNATIISDETPSNVFGPRAEACKFWNVELPRLREANAAAGRSVTAPSNVPKSCSTVNFPSDDGHGHGQKCSGHHHHQHKPSGGVHGNNLFPAPVHHDDHKPFGGVHGGNQTPAPVHHDHKPSGGIHGGNVTPAPVHHLHTSHGRVTAGGHHDEPKCVPGTTKKMDCNTCMCGENGLYACTKMFCMKFNPKAITNPENEVET